MLRVAGDVTRRYNEPQIRHLVNNRCSLSVTVCVIGNVRTDLVVQLPLIAIATETSNTFKDVLRLRMTYLGHFLL